MWGLAGRVATKAAAVGLLAGACAFSGCDVAPNTLEGGLSSYVNVGFETVRARLYSTELAIEYVDVDQAVPVRLTVSAAVDGPATIDLSKYGDITGRRDGVNLPEMSTGTLYLTGYSRQDGEVVTGRFEATFSLERTDADGTAEVGLSGTFEAPLEVVQ